MAIPLLFFESSARKGTYWISLVNAGGGPVRPLLKGYPGTFWLCEWAPDSKHLIAEAIVGTRIKLLQIDVRTGESSTLADILNAGGDMTASADGRILAFVAEKADSPPDVWSLTTDQPPRQLTNFNPQIASLKLGNVSNVTWTNRKDGQALHGVLVTPADFKSGHLYPTIVEVHPGNDAWWFGWQGSWWQWAQLLASNGYAVFLPNPRGSTGQGWEFGELFHSWISDAAFDDTMDGIDSLIAQKIADPDRLGIGGWSNGGFLSAWAITHTNRFKAAVLFAAPVDLELSWGATDIGGFFQVTVGDTPLRNRQLYESRSPFFFVKNCGTPALILHGETDQGVPIAQTYAFYHALKALGVETEMVVYPREGHSIEERAHQIDFQTRVLAWYDKHLK
jgi:dipeptidyl aminopeptidase/acylaminoacyl peptidase